MKKQGLVILFFLLLAVNIAGVESGNPLLVYLSKPLLMPLLLLFILIHSAGGSGTLKKWITLALFFSWAGDVLLIFQENIPDFFLFGLSAFLLAHVFYFIFFQTIRIGEGIRGRYLLLVPVLAYYFGLMIWLSPYLGDMTMPVRIYGIVISFMLMLALHMVYIRDREAGRWMLAGAVLFVLSDSILAINRFYMPFELAGAAIMATYGLAQYLIARGAVRYMASQKK